MKYLWISLIPWALLTAIVLSPIGGTLGLVFLLSYVGAPLYFAMTAVPTIVAAYACFVVAYTLLRIVRINWVIALVLAALYVGAVFYKVPEVWNADIAKRVDGLATQEQALVVRPAVGEVVGIHDARTSCDRACQDLLLRRTGTVVVVGRFFDEVGAPLSTPLSTPPAGAKAWVLRAAQNGRCPRVDVRVYHDDLEYYYELLKQDGLCIAPAPMPKQVDILFRSDATSLEPRHSYFFGSSLGGRELIQSQVWTRDGDAMTPIHSAYEGSRPVFHVPLILYTDASRDMELKISAAPKKELIPLETTEPVQSLSDLIQAVFTDMNALPSSEESLAELDRRKAENDQKEQLALEQLKANLEAERQRILQALEQGDVAFANEAAEALFGRDKRKWLAPEAVTELVLAGLATKGADVSDLMPIKLDDFIDSLPPEERQRAIQLGFRALLSEPDTKMDGAEGNKHRIVIQTLLRKFDADEFKSYESDIEALITTRAGRFYGKRMIAALGVFGPAKMPMLDDWAKQVAASGDLGPRGIAVPLSASLCLMGPDAPMTDFLRVIVPIKHHQYGRVHVIEVAIALGMSDADIAALVYTAKTNKGYQEAALADIAKVRARWATRDVSPDLSGFARAEASREWCMKNPM